MLIFNFYYIVFVVSVICGLWVFVFKCKYLLNILLSLEYIMLSIFWIMSLYFFNMGYESYFVLFFLILVVCEGVLGLVLLVLVVCMYGNDCFSSFSVL